jgi:hypothetical protein
MKTNTYEFGRIGPVTAEIGIGSTSLVVIRLLKHFASIDFGLLVGIGVRVHNIPQI